MIKTDEPMSDYLANPAIQSSQLKNMLLSPKDYLYGLTEKKKDNNSQSKGTRFHSYILERDLYHDEHIIQPEDWGPLSKNPGKKLWDEFKKKAKEEGKTPVKYSEACDLLLLEKEMEKHEKFQEILHTHYPEVSFYGEIDGIKLKSREDLWNADENTVWDVKTCSKTLDDETLEKVIFDYGYHFSAAHHSMCMDLCGHKVKSWGWIFVATGSPAPHIVIKKASKELMQAGMDDWNYAFQMLRECQKKNSWPGYSDEIEEISLPDWVERKYY